MLERCGRSHGIADVYKAIEDVHQAGVSNWSLDLISGLPYTDLDAWKHSLEEALQAGPTHISVYDLQVTLTNSALSNAALAIITTSIGKATPCVQNAAQSSASLCVEMTSSSIVQMYYERNCPPIDQAIVCASLALKGWQR